VAVLSCADAAVLGGSRIVITRSGAWYADLILDTTTAPTGAVTIVSDDGTLSLEGTVAFGGVWQGHTDLRVEAGGGHWDGPALSARFYRDPTLRIVLTDALRDAGEQLDPSVDSALLDTPLSGWTRRRATLKSTLGDIVRFACPPGSRWRTTPSGKVWIGTDDYLTETFLPEFELMDWQPSELRAVITSELPSPFLVPGVLFGFHPDLPSGRISQVEHEIFANGTETVLSFADLNFGDRVASPLERTIGQVLSQMRLLARYPGEVTAQHANNTVDVRLDVPANSHLAGLTGSSQMPDLAKVPIRSMGPQVIVKVAAGARVQVEFEGGSPMRPVVVGFETDSGTLTTLNVGGTRGVARIDDTVDLGSWQTVVTSGSVSSIIWTPPGGGTPVTLPIAPVPPVALTGKVSSASAVLETG
jgi:hypothetical protein